MYLNGTLQNHIPALKKRGKKRIVSKFPEIVGVVKKKLEDNSPMAQGRRRTDTMYVNGVTLSELRHEVLNSIPELEDISKDTIHRMMIAPNKSRNNSKSYHEDVPGKIPPKMNDDAKTHPNSHYASSLVNSSCEFASCFPEDSAIFSCDDKNKLHVGQLAVSRHFQHRRFYSTDGMPNYPDHDFPFANSKLTPHGYMRLIPRISRSRSMDRMPSIRPFDCSRRSRSLSLPKVIGSIDSHLDSCKRLKSSWPRSGNVNIT